MQFTKSSNSRRLISSFHTSRCSAGISSEWCRRHLCSLCQQGCEDEENMARLSTHTKLRLLPTNRSNFLSEKTQTMTASMIFFYKQLSTETVHNNFSNKTNNILSFCTKYNRRLPASDCLPFMDYTEINDIQK